MNGPILNFEVFFYAYQTEFQLIVSSTPRLRRRWSQTKAEYCEYCENFANFVDSFNRPRAALILGLAPHPGRPLSSDLAPALVITLRPQLRYLACTYWISTGWYLSSEQNSLKLTDQNWWNMSNSTGSFFLMSLNTGDGRGVGGGGAGGVGASPSASPSP